MGVAKINMEKHEAEVLKAKERTKQRKMIVDFFQKYFPFLILASITFFLAIFFGIIFVAQAL